MECFMMFRNPQQWAQSDCKKWTTLAHAAAIDKHLPVSRKWISQRCNKVHVKKWQHLKRFCSNNKYNHPWQVPSPSLLSLSHTCHTEGDLRRTRGHCSPRPYSAFYVRPLLDSSWARLQTVSRCSCHEDRCHSLCPQAVWPKIPIL